MAKPDYLSKIDEVALQHSTVKSYDQRVVEAWNNFEDLASKLDPQYDILNPQMPGGFIAMTTEFINLLYQNNDSSWEADVEQIREKNKAYGESWCKRGGTGAYHALARKGDRIVEITNEFGSLTAARLSSKYSESIDDTLGDLRRYLILVVAWYAATPTEEKIKQVFEVQLPPYAKRKRRNDDYVQPGSMEDGNDQPMLQIPDEPVPPPSPKCQSCPHKLDAHDEDGCNGLTTDGEVCGCTRKGHG